MKDEKIKKEAVGHIRRSPPVMNLKVYEEFRKKLRQESSQAEQALWTRLKNKQLEGKKFRHQHGIGKYVLDFYCPAEKLAVELDGPVHDSAEAREYDSARDKWISSFGIKVLRFRNEEVFENIDSVLDAIAKRF